MPLGDNFTGLTSPQKQLFWYELFSRNSREAACRLQDYQWAIDQRLGQSRAQSTFFSSPEFHVFGVFQRIGPVKQKLDEMHRMPLCIEVSFAAMAAAHTCKSKYSFLPNRSHHEYHCCRPSIAAFWWVADRGKQGQSRWSWVSFITWSVVALSAMNSHSISGLRGLSTCSMSRNFHVCLKDLVVIAHSHYHG